LNPIPHGIYERLVDEYLRDVLARHPELRRVLRHIDPEEQPSRYASFSQEFKGLTSQSYKLFEKVYPRTCFRFSLACFPCLIACYGNGTFFMI